MSKNTFTHQFKAGVLAYQNKCYTEAEALWLQVKSGPEYGSAAYNLAILYELGYGRLNYDGADLDWYQRSAKDGFAVAQFNLGGLYYRGERLPKNIKNAIYWWAQAGNQGHTESQHNLAVLLVEGKEVPQDLHKAQHWLSLSTELGYQPSKSLLANVQAQLESMRLSNPPVLSKDWQQQHQNWLLNQEPDDYTLELFCNQHLQQVLNLLESVNITEVSHLYHYKTNYIVVAGSFNTRHQALSAIPALSDDLQRLSPKPRKLAMIQAQLNGKL